MNTNKMNVAIELAEAHPAVLKARLSEIGLLLSQLKPKLFLELYNGTHDPIRHELDKMYADDNGRSSRKITMIKWLRGVKDISLRDAKDYVEDNYRF